MKEYCACKRQQLMQKRSRDEKESEKPKDEKAPAADANATANATNATNATAAPAKEVNLEDLKCFKPKNATGLECNLDG